MDIEESKILLKDFQKGKIEKDKLENYKGGYKIGYFYTADIQEAIETVLNELEKKDKVINEMVKFIAGLDIDELICKNIEHCTGDYEYETCEECIKEYFTNKAENVGE